MALQIRRGLENERTAGGGVVFAEGELVYITNTDALYVGDGSTAGGVKLTDNAGAVLGSYITADTVSSTLDLQQNLDLNGKDIIGTGNINIAGTINATGNVNIGDDVNTDTVDFAAKITSSLTPNADSTYNIGTTTERWNNGYFTGLVVDGQVDAVAVNANVVADNSSVMVNVSNNIFTGAFAGNVTGNILGDITGDSAGTHTGNVIGNVTGSLDGDITGSVFGDDSTLIVDAINKTLTGNLTGNTAGVHTGDVTGNVTGSVKGSGGSAVLAPNAGPADAVLSLLDITATGTIGGNLTGNVTGNAAGDHTGTFAGVITATGTFDGDITGSVFGDDSTLIVDAINKTLIGNVTGNVTGDTAGVHTGNIFTNLIDSADSSAIIVTPVFQVESDLIASNALIVGTGNVAGPGGPNVILKNTGEILANTITASSIGAGSAAVEFNVISKLGLKERAAFEKAASFQDAVSVQTIAGAFTGSFAVETFTGDPESDAEIADVSNYNKHFEATTTKVSFGVPAQMAVVADDSARGTLVPSPAAGMMLFMTAGSAPSATTQLQVYNGSAWVNV